MENAIEKDVQPCACGEGCQCAEKECKCHQVCKCAYKVAKIVLKAATVCALFRVAKEVHKVHKAIEHNHRHHL